MSCRWVLRTVDRPDVVATIQKQLRDLPEALARILVLRGIDTFEKARKYFRASFEILGDPLLMEDLPAAVERIAHAITQRERILVYGDYDVDGTTSVALLTHFLRAQGLEVNYFIPHRLKHGYGLHKDGIDRAIDLGVGLILAVDCGITAFDEALYARAKGIDLIICDHHTAGETIPEAVAVIDPHRHTCLYPFKELSACGLVFRLVQAVLGYMEKPVEEAHAYLDLVALSTACDVVPLQGENRVLLREGLQSMRQMCRPGIEALAQAARMKQNWAARLNTRDLAFTFGPRINAAGRMGSASRVVDLLLSDAPQQAAELAAELEEANTTRRNIEQGVQEQALAQAEDLSHGKMPHAFVLHQEDWHPGVLGIVASRVKDHYQRPVVMLCTSNGEATGSARSIVGINIHDALRACEDLFTRFGGHSQAAGLTLPEENLPAFRERLDAIVQEQMTPEMMILTREVDAELDLDTINRRFQSIIHQLPPYGKSNEEPLFLARHLQVTHVRVVGKRKRHLKLSVRQSSEGSVMDVIAFSMGDKLSEVEAAKDEGRCIEMVFSVGENTYRGRTTLELNAKDLRVKEVVD